MQGQEITLLDVKQVSIFFHGPTKCLTQDATSIIPQGLMSPHKRFSCPTVKMTTHRKCQIPGGCTELSVMQCERQREVRAIRGASPTKSVVSSIETFQAKCHMTQGADAVHQLVEEVQPATSHTVICLPRLQFGGFHLCK